jgi:hypothetical protein
MFWREQIGEERKARKGLYILLLLLLLLITPDSYSLIYLCSNIWWNTHYKNRSGWPRRGSLVARIVV